MFYKSMKCDVRAIKRVRTDEERERRRLHGDAGAKFSSRKFALGGVIMTGLTTVPDKDNIIFEIVWI